MGLMLSGVCLVCQTFDFGSGALGGVALVPRLTVVKAKEEEVYRDIVRVPEAQRTDRNGRMIKEGEICEISGNHRKAFAILRGNEQSTAPNILMDERTRNALCVCLNQKYEFQFTQVSLWGQARWAWSASDIGYRVATRIAIVALVLGILGFIPTFFLLMRWVFPDSAMPR